LIVAVGVAAIVCVLGGHTMLFIQDALGARSARIRLLCKIDHPALLDAGRDLLAQAADGALSKGNYHLRGKHRIPEGIELPAAILHLRPRTMMIRDGYMALEMHGGMDHFGFRIYAADFKEPYQGYINGHRKIIDGLWYHDKGYDTDPNYDKAIDALIEKHRGN